jgi:hypothetical protein
MLHHQIPEHQNSSKLGHTVVCHIIKSHNLQKKSSKVVILEVYYSCNSTSNSTIAFAT